jgi:hypothetical protein
VFARPRFFSCAVLVAQYSCKIYKGGQAQASNLVAAEQSKVTWYQAHTPCMMQSNSVAQFACVTRHAHHCTAVQRPVCSALHTKTGDGSTAVGGKSRYSHNCAAHAQDMYSPGTAHAAACNRSP